MVIASYDRDAIRAQFNAAQPFRWFTIAPFLDAHFAHELAASYPSFEQSRALGFEFRHLNEQRKVQISDSARASPSRHTTTRRRRRRTGAARATTPSSAPVRMSSCADAC
jgi:hypothetical protein